MADCKLSGGEGRVERSLVAPYRFGDHAVRVETVDGQPWFIAADVCGAIGIAHHRDALSRLEDDERGSVLVDTPGGRQSMAAVSESGLYALILRSRRAAAKRFRRWVTGEVLPSIRRTGGYGAPAASLDLSDPAVLHRLLLDHTGRAMAIEARNAELAPQAVALARLTDAEGALCITDAAKALGVAPRALFDWLSRSEWIYRRTGGSHWIGYQVRVSAGLLEHKVARIAQRTGPDKFREQVLVTPKGLAKLAELQAGA